MATITAMAIFGQSHPNDGGIAGEMQFNPALRLSENSRPGWIFRAGDYFRVQGKTHPAPGVHKFVLIPTLEHPLDDGLLLPALVLFHDQPWGEAACRMRDELLETGRLEMYSVEEQHRTEARQEVRDRSDMFPKMVLSVFQRDSLIHGQIGLLRHYQHEMSVCMPVFTRSRSQWSRDPHEEGTLEGPMRLGSR